MQTNLGLILEYEEKNCKSNTLWVKQLISYKEEEIQILNIIKGFSSSLLPSFSLGSLLFSQCSKIVRVFFRFKKHYKPVVLQFQNF